MFNGGMLVSGIGGTGGLQEARLGIYQTEHPRCGTLNCVSGHPGVSSRATAISPVLDLWGPQGKTEQVVYTGKQARCPFSAADPTYEE